MTSLRTIRPAHHPIPFLLYMEWVLLGMAIVSEPSPTWLPQSTAYPGGAIVLILAFGGLGLWLPLRPPAVAIVHVASQFGLIFWAARIEVAGLRLFPLLYVVLVIRSCLLFGLRGRLCVTGIAFVAFIMMVQTRLRALDQQLSPMKKADR